MLLGITPSLKEVTAAGDLLILSLFLSVSCVPNSGKHSTQFGHLVFFFLNSFLLVLFFVFIVTQFQVMSKTASSCLLSLTELF